MSKLKEIRELRCLTQEKLGQAIGSNKSYICRLENGTQDITRIRTDTMQRICSVLDCKSEDLLEQNEPEFEYDETQPGYKFLIIDGLYWCPMFPNAYIIKIEDTLYKLNFNVTNRILLDKRVLCKDDLLVMNRPLPEERRELNQSEYITNGCAPRGGFKVELGRAIKSEEFDNLKVKYNISDNDVSGEYIDTVGTLYGKYAKEYTAIQVRLDGENPISVAEELSDKGIQAFAGNADRITIRVR